MAEKEGRARGGAGASGDSDQSARFVELARELGADVGEEEAERAFARLVPPRRPGDPPPAKPEPGPAGVRSGRGRPRKGEG